MKFTLALFFGFLFFGIQHLFAQLDKQYVFHITLVDYQQKSMITEGELRYTCQDQQGLIKTDSMGVALVLCASDTLMLHVFAPLYKRQSNLLLKKREAISRSGDTLFYQLFLQIDVDRQTRDVLITNPYKPQEVFASERLSVEDFEILNDNRLLLLTYERTLKKGAELLLVDAEEIILANIKLGTDAKHLFSDFRGLHHLMRDQSLDYIHLEDDEIALVPMDIDYFNRYLAPIIDTSRTKFYFTNYRETYPAADFFVYDELDSTYFKMAKVSDEIIMDMYIKEYLWMDVRTKLWAREMEQATGRDKEDIVGEAYFTQSIFYKPLYVPMFLKNDTVYLFDFYSHCIKTFNREGQALDSIAISMHLQPHKNGWSNKLIQDPVTGNVFTLLNQSGYAVICNVNLQTGSLGIPIRLDFRYVNKLIIHDNTAYYTYRPYESKQKKFLYKQLLPLYSNQATTFISERRKP